MRPMIFEGTPFQNGEEESKARDAAKVEAQKDYDPPLPCDVTLRYHIGDHTVKIGKGKPLSLLILYLKDAGMK